MNPALVPGRATLTLVTAIISSLACRGFALAPLERNVHPNFMGIPHTLVTQKSRALATYLMSNLCRATRTIMVVRPLRL